MGQLLYGSPPEGFEVDDRTLAHIEVVALAKLRRNEGFALTLEQGDAGRTTMWISTSSDLRFSFDAARHEINRAWLDVLMDSANMPAGLRVEPEPTAEK